MATRGEAAPRFVAPEDAEARSIRRELASWYRERGRDLPWRATTDPYAIWVSETMLQQTRVETVTDYWPRFLERFPTAEALAGADEGDVLELWSGLGYYRRAKALQSAAQVIAEEHGGAFPRDLDAALALPGVGPYTAGAVLSIAYDQPVAIVDGNVERVFSRLFGLDGTRSSGPLMRACWEAARSLVAREGDAIPPRVWNQALMELGALVCTPRSPSCAECPLAAACVAREQGDPEALPRARPPRQAVPVELEVYVVARSGEWLLEQRPPEGRMAGLWQFPSVERTESGLFPAELPGPLAVGLEPHRDLFGLSHGITHHRIRARVRAARFVGEVDAGPPLAWFSEAAAAEIALTGMARKVVERLRRADGTLFGGA